MEEIKAKPFSKKYMTTNEKKREEKKKEEMINRE